MRDNKMTTTIFLPDSDTYILRYISPDNTDIKFLPLDELDDFVGEYYFFINQDIDPIVDKLFRMEYISTMNENVQPSDSVDIKNHIKTQEGIKELARLKNEHVITQEELEIVKKQNKDDE